MREIPLLGITLPDIPLDTALIAGRAVFLVFCFALAAIAFRRWRRAAEEGARQFAEQTACLLERLAGIEQQITATNARIAELAERVENELQRPSQTAGATPSYQIAIRLARSGASCEELMQSCALSRQEAELVQRLHAPPRRLRSVAG